MANPHSYLIALCVLVALSAGHSIDDGENPEIDFVAARLPVESVTVFADRAEVTRTILTTRSDTGVVDFVVKGLPADSIIANSLRVEVSPADADGGVDQSTSEGDASTTTTVDRASVTIVGVAHERARRARGKTADGDDENGVEARADAIRARIVELEAEIRAVDSDRSRLNRLWTMVERWGDARFGSPTKDAWEDMDSLTAALDWTSARFSAIDEERAANAARRDDLHKALRLARVELSALAGGTTAGHSDIANVVDVTVTLDVVSPGSVSLRLKYIMRSASWRPIYDVRFDAERKSMDVVYYGEVHQSTGEDWPRTKLRLSTATPAVAGSPPPLRSTRVRWASPEQHYLSHHDNGARGQRGVHAMRRADAKAARQTVAHMEEKAWAADSLTQMDASMPELVLTGAALGASGVSGGFTTVAADEPESSPPMPRHGMSTATAGTGSAAGTTTFEIAKATTVRNNGKARRVAIKVMTFDATVVHEVVPSQASAAFLRASADNTAGVPLLASDDVSVFVDGAFVARSSFSHVSPGQTFKVYLGVDADVRVSVKAPDIKHSKSSSVFGLGQQMEVHTHRAVTHVTNAKSTPIHLVVTHSLPASDDERIEVQLTQPPKAELRGRNIGEACQQPPGTGGVAAPVPPSATAAADVAGRCICMVTPGAEAGAGATASGSGCFRAGAAVLDDPRRVTRHVRVAAAGEVELPFEYALRWPSDDPNHHSGVDVYREASSTDADGFTAQAQEALLYNVLNSRGSH